VAEQLWRGFTAVRLVTLIYAAVIIIHNDGGYAHPVGGYIVLAIMTGWSALSVLAYRRPPVRRRWLIAADLAIAATLVVSTRWVDTLSHVNHGAPTLPTYWAAVPVLACAVAGGPWAGLGGAAAISLADLLELQRLPRGSFNGTVLLVIVGVVGGYFIRLGLRAEETLAKAARLEAATAERERLARGIHGSVLQVLALVSRRGRELGGPAAQLGQLAGEQETALRALVAAAPAPAPIGQLDLRTLIEPLAGERVTVSCPAGSVSLPDATARALAEAAREALDNVRRHAGQAAQAWVLVEDDGTAVCVSVRDNGAGFGPARLAEAAQAGRLGVAQSIVGRLCEVGGQASVASVPGRGTEVELHVPRT
jgi:signal transduction histidine kinase